MENKKMTIRSMMMALVAGTLAWAPLAHAGDVLVSAAASLTNAFMDVGKQFQKTHPGTRVLFNFGASDVVLHLIVNGAPADVFASADEKAMDKAVAAKVVDAASRVDFARNQVVMIVPSDSKMGLKSVAGLNSADVKRVTLGNPASVPVGRYTRAALEKAGAWDVVQSKAVLADNVRQALDYVARDEVDAGFVFATDAAIMPDKVKVVQALKSPVAVRYPLALVARKGRSPEARAFTRYVLSPEGQAILAKYGFRRP
jgi:molybdate transport system substrate-binding protein